VVVQAFLNNRVSFIEMSDIIEETIGKMSFIEHPTIEEYEECDSEARVHAADMVKKSQLAS